MRSHILNLRIVSAGNRYAVLCNIQSICLRFYYASSVDRFEGSMRSTGLII